MGFSTKDIMGLFGNDKDFKLVDDTSTINKSEEDKSFKSNIKI